MSGRRSGLGTHPLVVAAVAGIATPTARVISEMLAGSDRPLPKRLPEVRVQYDPPPAGASLSLYIQRFGRAKRPPKPDAP